jgi:hypothetical protein
MKSDLEKCELEKGELVIPSAARNLVLWRPAGTSDSSLTLGTTSLEVSAF